MGRTGKSEKGNEVSRPADQIFLRLAVQRGCLTQEQAEAVHTELRQRAARGKGTKARHLCVQVGMLSTDQARTIKHEVRAYLERKANQESRPQRRIAGFEIESRARLPVFWSSATTNCVFPPSQLTNSLPSTRTGVGPLPWTCL